MRHLGMLVKLSFLGMLNGLLVRRQLLYQVDNLLISQINIWHDMGSSLLVQPVRSYSC
jgi:hypothetical protein